MVIFCEFFPLKDIHEEIICLIPWIQEFLSSTFVLIFLLQKKNRKKKDYIFLSTFNERYPAYSIMCVYSYMNG